jgi:ketopantoate reductase
LNIAVIGAGAWGTVFGGILRSRGHDVEILGRERENGVVEDAELVVIAVPSRNLTPRRSASTSTPIRPESSWRRRPRT